MPSFYSIYVFKNRHDAERAEFILIQSGLLKQKLIISSHWDPRNKYSEYDIECVHSISSIIFSVFYREILILLSSSLIYFDASFKLIDFPFRISTVLILIFEGIFIIFCVSLFSQLLIKLSAIILYSNIIN